MQDEKELFTIPDEISIREDANDIVIMESSEEEVTIFEFEEEEIEPESREEIPVLSEPVPVSGPHLSLDAWLDWKKETEEMWTYHPRCLVNGGEKLVGARKIDGTRYAVFWCLNDTFIAQRFEGEIGRNLYIPEGKPEDRPIPKGPPPPTSNEGAIRFSGKNFKLAGLRKWSIVMPREKLGELRYICEHQIESRKYKVFETENKNYIAFPVEDDAFLI